MKREECPVFKAINKKTRKNECEACPFTGNCPEDLFNDATAEVMKVVGDYLHGEVQKGNR